MWFKKKTQTVAFFVVSKEYKNLGKVLSVRCLLPTESSCVIPLLNFVKSLGMHLRDEML